MSINEDSNLRRRSKRNEGRPSKVHNFRLDPISEATLGELKEAFKSPIDPRDTITTAAVFRRALEFYRAHALRMDVRTEEYTKLRYGTMIPERRGRHRNSHNEQAGS
jgi:hypothetical protein